MKSFFSRINVPTMVAVFFTIVVDKKLGVTDKIVSRL